LLHFARNDKAESFFRGRAGSLQTLIRTIDILW
jgi:hypothetical protein